MDITQDPHVEDENNSGSSTSDSEGSEIEEEESRAGYYSGVKDIKTIGEFYEAKVLKAPKEGSALHLANASYLERVSLWQGDITRLDLDGIVNAANRSLLGGGGVDGAIHSAAGPGLLEECRGLNGCLTGESKITRGYNLPAQYVIHTVGPVYSSTDVDVKAAQLTSCYKTSLDVAVENGLRHVAFPSISTGIYSYPIVDATRIALDTVRKYLDSDKGNKLERVVFVVWSDKDLATYETLIPEYFPPADKSQDPNPAPEEVLTSESS
jgi:O-acetyl-ADP-ribose deacetylase (regulator of RNase III)